MNGDKDYPSYNRIETVRISIGDNDRPYLGGSIDGKPRGETIAACDRSLDEICR
jgi:hypothetical protein